MRFVDAEPNAEVFPGWSVVYCAESDPIKYPDDSIGTLRRTPFGATFRVAPIGLYDGHYCGTLDDFARGAHYDPDAPPIPVAADGWPRCCHPPVLVLGGAGAGGDSPWFAEGPPYGVTCCDAPVLALGTTYVITQPNGTTIDVWSRYVLPAANYRYTLDVTPPHPFTATILGFSGATCATAFATIFSAFDSGVFDFTLLSDLVVCIQIFNTTTIGEVYTFTLTAH